MSILKLPTEFTVSRKNWLRGDEDNSMLRDRSGKMCCMGFYAKACGYTDDEIRNEGDLGALALEADDSLHGIKDQLLKFHKSILTGENGQGVYAINDSDNINDATRESLLKARLAKHGVTVHFVD